MFILVVGPGRCGLHSVAALLNRQPDTHMTVEESPLLPWSEADPGAKIRARFARMRASRSEPIIGDAAGFYLPYLEYALVAEPRLRIVVMRRPRAELVASFVRFLDATNSHPTDHWAREPGDGWQHHPLRSRTYPKYDGTDRAANLERYWDEYMFQTDELASRHPDRVRVFDMHPTLNTKAGQSGLFDFLGYPSGRRRFATGLRESRAPERLSERGRCAVLVPFSGSIHPGCERSLQELERRGYSVRRVSGYAAVDQARNQMATDALLDGFDETMWIDSDVEFDPDAVDRVRSHGEPICCGIYPQKGRRAVTCHVLAGTDKLIFGEAGGMREILYAACGFLHVRRQVYLDIQRRLTLPVLNERFGSPVIPFFQPMVVPHADGEWYLAEDYAFCERARRCGFGILADTTIRLWHLGGYRYGWEDAGREMERNATFTLHLE